MVEPGEATSARACSPAAGAIELACSRSAQAFTRVAGDEGVSPGVDRPAAAATRSVGGREAERLFGEVGGGGRGAGTTEARAAASSVAAAAASGSSVLRARCRARSTGSTTVAARRASRIAPLGVRRAVRAGGVEWMGDPPTIAVELDETGDDGFVERSRSPTRETVRAAEPPPPRTPSGCRRHRRRAARRRALEALRQLERLGRVDASVSPFECRRELGPVKGMPPAAA